MIIRARLSLSREPETRRTASPGRSSAANA